MNQSLPLSFRIPKPSVRILESLELRCIRRRVDQKLFSASPSSNLSLFGHIANAMKASKACIFTSVNKGAIFKVTCSHKYRQIQYAYAFVVGNKKGK